MCAMQKETRVRGNVDRQPPGRDFGCVGLGGNEMVDATVALLRECMRCRKLAEAEAALAQLGQ